MFFTRKPYRAARRDRTPKSFRRARVSRFDLPSVADVLEQRVLLSHYRGGSLTHTISDAGVLTLDVISAWGSFESVPSFQIRTGPGGTGTLVTNIPSPSSTTLLPGGTELGGSSFTARQDKFTANLPALGVAAGTTLYARWTSNARVGGINNVPEGSWALENKIVYAGTGAGKGLSGPTVRPATIDIIAKGFEYRQNLNSSDPDGTPVNYAFLLDANGPPTSDGPDFAPTSNIPGINLDSLGTVSISTANTTAMASGRWVYKVRVTDGSGATAERDVLLVAQAANGNSAPDLVAIGPKVVPVGTPLTFNLTGNDANAGQTVTLRSQRMPAGATFNTSPGRPATGTFTWTPTAGQEGTYFVNFEAFDSAATPITTIIDSELVQITVTGANDPPVLDPIGNKTVANGGTLSFTLSGSDPNGNALTYEAFFLPAGAAFDPATRTFTWTPTAAQSNNVFTGVTFRVVDDGIPNLSDSETINITVGEGNQAPAIAAIADQTALAGQQLQFTVTATDSGAGQTVTLAPLTLPPGASFVSTPGTSPVSGTFTWTPTAAQAGPYTITFRAEDNGTPILNSTRSVVINVVANQAPVAVSGTLSAVEDTPVGGTLPASDPDSDPLTYSIVGNGAKGTAVITDPATGAYTYTPNADANGGDTFTFRVNDGQANSNVATITVSIAPVNDAPSFTAGADQSVLEDAGAVDVPGWAGPVAAGPSDESGQSLNFEVTGNSNPGLFAVGPAIDASGRLTYTPAANASGVATIAVVLHDSGGTANSGSDTSAAQTFTITVGAAADAPSLSVSPAAGNEAAAIPLDIDAALADADGSEWLSIRIGGNMPADVSPSAGTRNPDGTWTLTPGQLDGRRSPARTIGRSCWRSPPRRPRTRTARPLPSRAPSR